MKFTQYFFATRETDDRKNIKLEWIEFVYNNSVLDIINTDGRIKHWAYIDEV